MHVSYILWQIGNMTLKQEASSLIEIKKANDEEDTKSNVQTDESQSLKDYQREIQRQIVDLQMQQQEIQKALQELQKTLKSICD